MNSREQLGLEEEAARRVLPETCVLWDPPGGRGDSDRGLRGLRSSPGRTVAKPEKGLLCSIGHSVGGKDPRKRSFFGSVLFPTHPPVLAFIILFFIFLKILFTYS